MSTKKLRGDTPSILRATAHEMRNLARLLDEGPDEEACGHVAETLRRMAGIVQMEALRVQAGSTGEKVAP